MAAVYCPSCGKEVGEAGLCAECAQAQQSAAASASVPTAAPESAAALAPEPAVPPAAEAPPKKRRGCRTCLLGCLSVFVGLILLVLGVACWFFNWPAEWGLVASPAEKLFEPSPDPYAGEAIEAELASQGIAMEGVTVYVLPSPDTTATIAYVLVEQAEGATWSHETYGNGALGFMVLTATTQAADDFEVERVAVDYRDDANVQAAVVTAPTPVLRDFAAGAISEEDLFDEMNGYVDIAGFLGGMTG